VIWTVAAKRHSAALVDLLDRYPLLSKKARDYEIWRRAVIAWQRNGQRSAHNGENDWSAMTTLKSELEAVRLYVPAVESAPGD
jgi:hypothetical protein